MTPDLEMEYVNAAAVELLGLPENIIGEKINRFLKEIDWNALLAMDFNAWEGFSRQEIEVFYPKQRVLTFYLLPQQDESGQEIEKIALVLHDITEMRQEAESVKESELLQAMTMLAAGVAHEIGNPLNSLNIHLQLMERLTKHIDKEEISKEAKELLEICTSEVERLDMIIHQFLGAVRSTKPELMQIRVDEILAESLQFMKAEIENKNIEVEAILADKITLSLEIRLNLNKPFIILLKMPLKLCRMVVSLQSPVNLTVTS